MLPKHLSGRPWGHCAVAFELPAESVCVNGLSQMQRDALLRDYQGFAVEANKSVNFVHTCAAYQLENRVNVPMQELIQGNIYSPTKSRQGSDIEISGYNFRARVQLSLNTDTGSLGVYSEQELVQSDVIENFLRIFTAHKALSLGGVVLHSAGVVFAGQAYIFVGYSGAGKTTLSRKALQLGVHVLSDDLNLVLPDRDNGYRAHAVPFAGDLGRTLDDRDSKSSFPLGGVVLLDRGEQLQTTAVSQSRAVAMLITGCPFVNMDTEESEALFDVLTMLTDKVPVIGMQCRSEDSIESIMAIVKRDLEHA